ncbi:hypothetical protein EJ02DRAFT_450004 [Clathrospora elynae]|uniref:Uncharacterized protein n=1 Tax=Clathrospora elynae TaxID=706981 RepID=A0A6A5T5N8_9PLEO|nr:hypothetical protein EJ02DRAFT_450004 [Clathrospora elynae]
MTPTSTPGNSTNMSPIEAAAAAIELLEPGDIFTYTAIADAHVVNRVTPSQRHKHSQALRKAQAIKQQKLDPQQELELVQYIKARDVRSGHSQIYPQCTLHWGHW